MKYIKPSLPIADQIKHLEGRGLVISDHAKAAHYLSNISYYRLSAYLYPYRQLPTDNYVTGTTFDEVLDHYLFDREFRLLVFDAVERVEIAFRTQLIYQPSNLYGPFWFLDPAHFGDRTRWAEQVKKIDEEVARSGEVFIKHFFAKYSSEKRPPAWISFEVASLGLLSRLYNNLKFSSPAKKHIANHFGLSEPRVFQSWIRSMTYVRNICAHHSRLWNRTLTETPKLIQKPPSFWVNTTPPANDKIYYFLCCLVHMLRQVNPQSSFIKRLRALFEKYTVVDCRTMGFPIDWKDDPYWK
ncbi:MAG: Abi family protein [Chloracidobacterium sp.]|nr:Abi family protein [Chloracidobacterium sp.]